jgi:hypothetical protein
MKLRMTLAGLAIVACLAFALPQQDSRPAQDDLAKKVENLTRALDAEKKRTSDLEERLDRVDMWFRSMASASVLLDTAADEARINGFEEAGANPFARAIVLDGMKDFAAEMTRLVPATPTPRR